MNPTSLKGFFTTQIQLQGRTLADIESRLGFESGRLSQGAWFVAATQLPTPDEFEFAGYSQVAGHHTQEQYGDLNSPIGEHERAAYLLRKRNIISSVWSLNGDRRLIKVLPTIDHNSLLSDDHQYPPGTGIPQWKIIARNGIPCRAICFVSDYPNGRFIPDEGYTPVRYT